MPVLGLGARPGTLQLFPANLLLPVARVGLLFVGSYDSRILGFEFVFFSAVGAFARGV